MNIIDDISPHSIKKFELIEAYTKVWAYKLLEYGKKTGRCKYLVFIDCMSNSGIYINKETKEQVYGTPVRVANVLSEIMKDPRYQNQHAYVYFNDLLEEKINELKKHLPQETHNFHITTSFGDANKLLKDIGKQIKPNQKVHYLLEYDPFEAAIDWDALLPFIRNWGEIIINHMVSDPIRGISQAKQPETVSKYEQTYLTSIDSLLNYGTDRNAYEQRIKNIITALQSSSNRPYYIASFPFFNSKNAVVYNLIHCTSNIKGFKLYKSTAWSTFGNKSSIKKTKSNPDQMMFDFDFQSDVPGITTETDENCYYVQDIVNYIIESFYGRMDVSLVEIWNTVDQHPVFPSDLYKDEIKERLRELGYRVHRSSIDFVKAE